MTRRGWSIVELCLLVLGATASLATAGDRSDDGVWTRIGMVELDRGADAALTPWIQPQHFQAVRLSADALEQALDHAPMEFTAGDETGSALLSLPTPDGGFETFRMVVSPVMAPELEAWMASQGWPMRTYSGVSLDHPATSVRLDWGGPTGFHASVLSPQRSYYIDPYWQGDQVLYTSYFKSGYVRDHDFRCLVEGEPATGEKLRSGASTNGNLRTYRLVVAATGEYTAFYGGTAPLGQAAIVTTINRVNQVYENDLSIRMVLVGNNNLVVYTDGATDPYTNNNGFTMLGENQANVDSVIGTANYDIGHVVSTGGGGVANLGVPCTAGWKARGVTGSGSPVGDPFDIDYVAHEMGHQWGGNHTFNSTTSNCGGGNRNASTAYEPGSGSTIQGYAGICGADDLQAHSDSYFHGISLDEMLNYAAGGGACSVNTSAGNPNAPTVGAGLDHTIPISTPFEMTVASSNDPDGDTLTFTWEQFNLGAATTLAQGDTGAGPILRSFTPTTSTIQQFPHNGSTPVTGEVLPTTNRTITFRLTARDNHAGGGRVGEDVAILTSTTSAGPFAVTAPNGGESWNGAQTVTWNVANTNAAPVNTANVDILLSTDGGATYPTTLLSGTPNDGSQSVALPSVNTSLARIKIKGSGNVFYDTSNANFTIGTVMNQTLYDQSAACVGGYTSQYFPDFAAGLESADDITVPVGEQWTLGNVAVEGSFNVTSTLTSVNVYVWSDSSSLPGSIVSGCSFTSLSPIGALTDPNVSVDLPPTCVLDPGTYWIEVQPVMNFNPGGHQWFWGAETGSFGAEFAFRDAANLLTTVPCPVWSNGPGCLTAANTDLCFTISGSSAAAGLVFEDGFETGNTTMWSTTIP
jgi:hypothetical protein